MTPVQLSKILLFDISVYFNVSNFTSCFTWFCLALVSFHCLENSRHCVTEFCLLGFLSVNDSLIFLYLLIRLFCFMLTYIWVMEFLCQGIFSLGGKWFAVCMCVHSYIQTTHIFMYKHTHMYFLICLGLQAASSYSIYRSWASLWTCSSAWRTKNCIPVSNGSRGMY